MKTEIESKRIGGRLTSFGVVVDKWDGLTTD